MNKVYVNLYCDEIKECVLKLPLSDTNHKWTYMGLLIVPDCKAQQIYKELVNLRCLANPKRKWGDCKEECKWHAKNNTEVHYQKLDNSIKYQIASKWVQYWLADRENIYFYILGLDLTNLDRDRFGPSSQQDRHSTIYNRFFRTAITKSLKSYFAAYDRIIVQDIYHDRGNQEHHKYFPWHAIFKINEQDEKVYIASDSIRFIDSDHRKEDGHDIHSHFIQFIDIILGCVMNCLHLNSTALNKLALAKESFKLVEKLINNPGNINSPDKYVGRQKIEFFPKRHLRGLDENSLEYQVLKLDQFYTQRPLMIESEITGQGSLF